MTDKTKLRLEKALSEAVENIDKTNLRPLLAEVHRCSAKCCDNRKNSIEQNKQCIERCSRKYDEAEEFVVTEFLTFFSNVQSCVEKCRDNAKNKIGSKIDTPESKSELNKKFEKCSDVCLEEYIALLPKFVKHIKKQIPR
uniref:Protein FAM136A n=1 Tax=Clastoptera arizonana TaxID=38151 RepID=A0A1B6D643_9HEMI